MMGQTETVTIERIRALNADRPFRLARLGARPLPHRLLPAPPKKIEITDSAPADTRIDVVQCRNVVTFVRHDYAEDGTYVLIGPRDQRLKIANIQHVVAKYYGVSVHEILSARRTANIVRPRQVGYYLAKMLTGKSLPEIGRRFGGRDHTSALSGIRKIERLRKTDAVLEADLQHLANALGGSLAKAS